MEALPLCLMLIFINAATFGATTGDSLSVEPRQIPPVPTPLFSCQCGRTNQSERIYNGVLAKPGEIPWQAGVLIKYVSVWDLNCGAVIISAYYLLSAEHCFWERKCRAYRIIAGITDSTLPARQHMVTHIILYPPTHVRNSNDIALIKIHLPLQFSDLIYPICLPPFGTTETFAGRNLTISGWGLLNNTGTFSNQLYKATVLGIMDSNCKIFRNPHTISPDMLCAWSKSDACMGDSGGPAGYKAQDGTWFLAGIISWGIPVCGDLSKPGVYVRITYFLDWIHNKTENSICTRPFNP